MPAFHSNVRVEDRALAMQKSRPDLSAMEIASALNVSVNSVRWVFYRHKISTPSFFARRAIIGRIKVKP